MSFGNHPKRASKSQLLPVPRRKWKELSSGGLASREFHVRMLTLGHMLVRMFANAWVHGACMWMCMQRVCESAAVSQLWQQDGQWGLMSWRPSSPPSLHTPAPHSSRARSVAPAGERWAALPAQPFLQAAADQGSAGIVCPLAHSGELASSGTLWEEGAQEGGAKYGHLHSGRELLPPRGPQSDLTLFLTSSCCLSPQLSNASSQCWHKWGDRDQNIPLVYGSFLSSHPAWSSRSFGSCQHCLTSGLFLSPGLAVWS